MENKLKLYTKENITEYLKDKTVAVVGNANSIFNKKHGKDIDNHDIVIRFNRGYIKSIEHQGSKTNIWVGACKEKEKNIVNKFNPELTIWTDNDLISIPNYSKNFMEKQFFYSKNYYEELICDIGLSKKKITSGVRILDFLIKYSEARKISIYGFDFFKTNSFYNKESLEDIHKNKPHDFTGEEKYVEKLIKNNCIGNIIMT